MNHLKTLLGRLKARPAFVSMLVLAAFIKLAFVMTSHTVFPRSTQDLSRTSVKIVRTDEQSGGSGVILRSTEKGSYVLTNSHVCGVVENGGSVITDDGKRHAVASFRRSEMDDLCLIFVVGNLKLNTQVSDSEPAPYSDAAISGHPELLPNIVTRGHFSDHVMVEVLTGVKACEKDDMKGPNAILCLLLGGLPVIHRYEAQTVSATIQPGSSGSAVFNSKGEIAGLVFAGSGTIGYAMTVPQASIENFLENELPNLKTEYPQNTFTLSLETAKARFRNQCMRPDNAKEMVKRICRLIENDMVWTSTK